MNQQETTERKTKGRKITGMRICRHLADRYQTRACAELQLVMAKPRLPGYILLVLLLYEYT